MRRPGRPHDRARVEEAVQQAFVRSLTNGDYDIEYRVIRLDGSTGWVQIRAKAGG